MERVANVYYKIGMFIMDLMVLQIMWVIGTVLGGVIFGIGPATIALFSCIRQKKINETIQYKWFIKVYREEFKQSNKLFIGLIGIGYVVIVCYRLILTYSEQLGMLAIFSSILLLSIYLAYIWVISSIYVHFHYDTIKQYFKSAFGILFVSPVLIIYSVIIFVIIQLIIEWIPGLYFFVGVSLTAYLSFNIIQVFLNQLVEKNNNKK